MQLRDYQDWAVDSVFKYYEDGNTGNPIIAAPTGTGKSPIIGGFCRRALEQFPGTRILKITHVKELIEQNFQKLFQVWPTAPAGIYSAGLKRKDIGFPITYAGIASLNKADLSQFGQIDLIIIDECHLISPKEETMYRKVIAFFLSINPNLKIIGLTATAWRPGQGMLTEGDTRLFTDICCDMTTPEAWQWFFDQGYLVKPVPKRTNTKVDLSKVRTRGGEFKEEDVQEAFDKDEITRPAVQEIIQEGQDRKCWLVFASGIEHCIHVADMLNYYGISATFVHSDTKLLPEKERDQRIADFKAGKYQAMTNNGILTTGFDHPPVDLIAILRATKSSGLWIQILGRGTRPVYAPGFDLLALEGRLAAIVESGKLNCLVLDFGRNRPRLGPMDNPVIPVPKGKGPPGAPPTKICDFCGAYCFAGAKECEFCGHEFPKNSHIFHEAGTESLVKEKEPEELLIVEVFEVDRVVYDERRKKDRPPHIKASYFCGLRMFTHRICLEHEGYAAKKGRDWWRKHCTTPPYMPQTTSEALAYLHTLKTPTHVRVWVKKKDPEILDYDFSGTAFGEENGNNV